MQYIFFVVFFSDKRMRNIYLIQNYSLLFNALAKVK